MMEGDFCPGPVATGIFGKLWFKDGPTLSTGKSMLPAETGLLSEDLQAPSEDLFNRVSFQDAST